MTLPEMRQPWDQATAPPARLPVSLHSPLALTRSKINLLVWPGLLTDDSFC